LIPSETCPALCTCELPRFASRLSRRGVFILLAIDEEVGPSFIARTILPHVRKLNDALSAIAKAHTARSGGPAMLIRARSSARVRIGVDQSACTFGSMDLGLRKVVFQFALHLYRQ
jgi:hypothetical protein